MDENIFEIDHNTNALISVLPAEKTGSNKNFRPFGGLDDGNQQVFKRGDLESAIHHLFTDRFDEKTRRSTIDMIANLESEQAMNISKFESLCVLGFFPSRLAFMSGKVKAMSVSIDARGRNDVVNLTRQNTEIASGAGVWDRIKNVFSPAKT